MGSRNRIDLVIYFRVPMEIEALRELVEATYAEDDTWDYRVESGAPLGESWLSRTLSSTDYDSFDALWIEPVDFKLEVQAASLVLGLHGLSILESGMGQVCWYDGSDRPFPVEPQKLF